MGLSGTAITPVDSTPDIYPPLTGTTVLAADVQSGEQAIADNLYSLSLGGAVVAVEDRAITMIWTGVTDVGAVDYWAATSYGGATQVPAPIGALVLAMQLSAGDLPHGATVTSIAVQIDPAAHGAAPANLPVATFIKINASTGATTTIGTATDTWNAGGYTSPHPLAILSLSEVINWDIYRYALLFTSEYGANSQAGLVVIGPTWTGTARSNRVNVDP